MRRTKDEVAQELIDWHFRVSPELLEVYRIRAERAEDEDREDEPIKLLEVDPESTETGHIDSFFFLPDGDITFPSVVALVTPNELKQVQRGALELPEGWTLAGAQRFPRPAHAGEGKAG